MAKALQAKGATQAGLIMCRGVAGVSLIPDEFISVMMGRMWRNLSDDDGLLVTQFPNASNAPKTLQWSKKLQKAGISSSVEKFGFGMMKHKNAPDKLPSMSDL